MNRLMYKTGDLARWLPNDEVEYLARAGFQIKMRGIRIEPGEIESTLATYPVVRTSLVVSKELQNCRCETSQEHLVGYFVCDEHQIPETDLLSFLERRLPRYTIPTRIIQLRQIPVTINGKADLQSLPMVDDAADDDIVPPRSELERMLADIWSEVLEILIKRIGIYSDLFALGGNSLKHPTIEILAHMIVNGSMGVEDIPRLSPSFLEVVPVSVAQERLPFIKNFDGGNKAYNITMHVEVAGPARLEALKEALRQIISKHEPLPIGVPVVHRPHPEFESVIGYFVNMVVRRVRVSQPKGPQTCRYNSKAAAGCAAISRPTIPKRYENAEAKDQVKENAEDIAVHLHEYQFMSPPPSVAKFDLNATAMATGPELSINSNYATSLFGCDTIRG
ncbi:hypothetical protein BBP40_005424 [Aspergillus hancockii]|nr:hypothetical protein BBP40_005424 [Aspergillus hancockii]